MGLQYISVKVCAELIVMCVLTPVLFLPQVPVPPTMQLLW